MIQSQAIFFFVQFMVTLSLFPFPESCLRPYRSFCSTTHGPCRAPSQSTSPIATSPIQQSSGILGCPWLRPVKPPRWDQIHKSLAGCELTPGLDPRKRHKSYANRRWIDTAQATCTIYLTLHRGPSPFRDDKALGIHEHRRIHRRGSWNSSTPHHLAISRAS